jgi:hypothetical protein
MDLIDLIEEQEIIEKQNRLLSEPDKDKFSYGQVRARAAKRDRDIDSLLKRGTSPDDVYYILSPLGVRPDHIRVRVAKLGLEEERDFSGIDDLPHVCAAIQGRTDKDSLTSKGDNIKYIYTDAQHSNPLCRVTPVKDIEKKNFRYDKEKYREMVLDAAQSVLGYFGFDRTDYGDERKTVPKKWRWIQEVRQQRENDIKTEMT